MSTQPFSSVETTTPKPFTTEATEEHRGKSSTDKSISTPALENHELRGPRVCATQFSMPSLQHQDHREARVCATQSKTTSLPDEPWKIRVLPEEPKAPQPASGLSGEPVRWLKPGQPQRTRRKVLPRIGADERRSEQKQAKAKPNTRETQRNGGKAAENRATDEHRRAQIGKGGQSRIDANEHESPRDATPAGQHRAVRGPRGDEA